MTIKSIKSVGFGTSFLLLLLSVESANGIKCFKCLNPNDDCANDELFQSKNGTMVEVDCNLDMDWRDYLRTQQLNESGFDPIQDPANACFKTKSQNLTGRTLRSCSIITRNASKCINTKLNGSDFEECYCTEDLCNGSPPIIPGLLITMFMATCFTAMSQFLS